MDAENWEWMTKNKIDAATGNKIGGTSCGPQLGIAGGSGHQTQAVVDAVVQQRDAGTGWLSRNRLLIVGGVIFVYVLIARIFSEGEGGA